jgi:hypothetical protein
VEEGRYDATVGVRILEYEGVVSGGEWVSGGVMQWVSEWGSDAVSEWVSDAVSGGVMQWVSMWVYFRYVVRE